MELRQLRYLVAVAEGRGYRRAAMQLGITQPAISRQIALLESELGVKLFLRLRSRIALTEAGQVLVGEAVHLLAQAEKAAQITKAVAQGDRGIVRLGYTRLTEFGYLARLLRVIAQRHPRIHVDFRNTALQSIAQDLKDGVIDIGISRQPLDSAALNTQVLQRDPLVAIVPADFSHGSRKAIKLQLLRDHVFIAMGNRLLSPYSTLTRMACEAAGFSPKRIEDVDDLEGALTLVSAGRGVALIPASLSRRTLPGVKVLKVLDPKPSADLVLMWRKEGLLPHFRLVLETILEANGAGRLSLPVSKKYLRR